MSYVSMDKYYCVVIELSFHRIGGSESIWLMKDTNEFSKLDKDYVSK